MNDERLPRREFGRRLAGGVACALPLAAVGCEGEAAWGQPVDEPRGLERVPPAGTDGPPSPAALAPEEHYLALVQQLYPDERLGESELQEVRRQIAAMLARSRALTSFPLTNGDEPATTFGAYRGTD